MSESLYKYIGLQTRRSCQMRFGFGFWIPHYPPLLNNHLKRLMERDLVGRSSNPHGIPCLARFLFFHTTTGSSMMIFSTFVTWLSSWAYSTCPALSGFGAGKEKKSPNIKYTHVLLYCLLSSLDSQRLKRNMGFSSWENNGAFVIDHLCIKMKSSKQW